MSGKKKPDLVYTNFYEQHMGLGNGHKSNPTKSQQSLTQRMYQRVLTELCINRFEWVGMPDSIDLRFLETNLFYRALTVFYFDKEYDKYLALQSSGVGRTNHYDNPTNFQVFGNNPNGTINKWIPGRECVPIWANSMRMPDTDIVLLYSMKLADIDRSIEINSRNLRNPKVVVAPEQERHSWAQIVRQINEGAIDILASNAMNMDQIQALDLGVDARGLEALWLSKTKLWNECMTLLGIDNANQDKKERLVVDEVNANDGQIESAKQINMRARQYAASQINQMFDLSVSVRYAIDSNKADLALGVV